jgi:hypothetical protein
MSESVLLDIFRGRVQVFEGAVASLRNRPQEDELAEDLEEIVKLCLDWPDAARRLWNLTVDRIAARRIRNFQATGEALRELFDTTLRFLDGFHHWTEDLKRRGLSIGYVEELGRAAEELRQLRTYAVSHWPWIDEAMVAEAVVDYKRGDSLPLVEAFADIAGVDSATWLRRVEGHQRSLLG